MSRISNYPHLIGVSDDERKELHGVNEVAAFICDQGRFGDLRVFTPYGEEVLNTFGIFIDRICDMEYREELMEVLVPKKKHLKKRCMMTALQTAGTKNLIPLTDYSVL